MLLAMMFSCQTIEDDGGSTEDNTASYTVEHYQQNIENDEFTLVNDDTEEKSGKIGEDTKAIAKTYDGFTAKTVTQEKITADGKTVVKIEYTRNVVTLTFDTDGGSEIASKSGKYGATFTITAPTKSGYKLNSWEPELPTTFPEEDTEYKAIWNELTPTENIEKFIEEIKALTEKGTHTIKVTGAISSSTISEIKTALQNLDEGIYVNLDLSKTTGRSYIENEAFSNCDKLAGISIPDSVTKIDLHAFSGCTGLTSVTIPDSVTAIGYYAFQGCTGLTSVTIPDSVTEIGSYAFKDCTGLTSVTIPDSVTEIGSYAFYGCTGLESVTIPDSVTEIGNYAFYGCTGLESVTIPDSVTSIGIDAFDYCSSLTTLTINTADNCLYSKNSDDEIKLVLCASNIKKLTIPDNVSYIDSNAFDYCNGIEEIVIGNGITSLDCLPLRKSTLKSITIGSGITKIASYTFKDCTNLTSVTIPDSVTAIDYQAFEGCTNLTSVTIPDSVTEIAWYAFQGCTGLTSVTIPDSVTEIGSYTFKGCTGLESVTIPDSVTSIGDWAFYGCTGLESVTIPDSVTSIGKSAFYGCSKLTSVTFADTTSTWYYTSRSDYTDGTAINVTDAATNATNLTETYYNKYWYKEASSIE